MSHGLMSLRPHEDILKNTRSKIYIAGEMDLKFYQSFIFFSIFHLYFTPYKIKKTGK